VSQYREKIDECRNLQVGELLEELSDVPEVFSSLLAVTNILSSIIIPL